MKAISGWLFQKGALDYVGGTVVHINAAVAGLVGAYVIGKRVGYEKEAFKPHILTLNMVGASWLWFGWFGFNTGSGLEANGGAALAFINTLVATACAVLTWSLGEWIGKGKLSMLYTSSRFRRCWRCLGRGFDCWFCLLAGCNWPEKILRADDSLDVFGVHSVGGILGVFAAPSLGGTGIYEYVTNAVAPCYSISGQLLIQLESVMTTVIWSGVVGFIAFKLVDIVIGLRVTEEEERKGLDISSHGESAYQG
ncbi:MAG: hypothetical protein H7240_12745 [Glaciimonas sp.]|nr:hypothetical protein [Glaciimonas sp.]